MTLLDRLAVLVTLAIGMVLILLPPVPVVVLHTVEHDGDQRDYGDETDVVPEGLGVPRHEPIDPREPHDLFCAACGHRAHAESLWIQMPPCPDCGGRRWTNRPDLPILGEPRELRP
jgi:hypothetical protein